MSDFAKRVMKNVQITGGKPPVVSATTSYTSDDLKAAGGLVDALCDESSQACKVACNYVVKTFVSIPLAQDGVDYIVSTSQNVTSVVKPKKPPLGDI